MHKYSIAVLAVLACVAWAQTTTDLLLFGIVTWEIDGSIIGSDATATTYSLSCPTAVNGEPKNINCYLGVNFLLTQGPSTVHYKASVTPYDSAETSYRVYEEACVLTGTSSAVCSQTVSRKDGASTYGPMHIEVDNIATNTDGLGAIPVTITAGATTSATNIAASTTIATSGLPGSSSASSGSTSITSSSTTPTATSSGTAAAVTNTSTSTGGVAMITGNAKWMVGAAAGLALAGM